MRRNKYHVATKERRTMDGITFASRAEMRRWQELRLLQQSGAITNLERQPSYVLVEPFTDSRGIRHRGIKYFGDFRYSECDRVVVEDVKGFRTRAYKTKREMFQAKYPRIIFREIKV